MKNIYTITLLIKNDSEENIHLYRTIVKWYNYYMKVEIYTLKRLVYKIYKLIIHHNIHALFLFVCIIFKYFPFKNWKNRKLTSFLFFSSSELKLLSNKAKKRLRTMKLPMTNAGRNMKKHVSGPATASARIQSHNGSIHSPHNIRKIIIKEWKKSLKFHLKNWKRSISISL